MSLPQQKLTPQEYLDIERKAETKSEFLDGEMFAMTGGSEPHALIILNIGAELRNRLKGRPCRARASELRVKITATGLYTYPDVIAACNEPQFEDSHIDTLLNPTVIFEVLSPSTEAYDRGKKFAYYRTVASLTDYVLVAQDRIQVERYTRQPDGTWTLTDWSRISDNLSLASIDVTIPLAEIYDKVSGLQS